MTVPRLRRRVTVRLLRLVAHLDDHAQGQAEATDVVEHDVQRVALASIGKHADAKSVAAVNAWPRELAAALATHMATHDAEPRVRETANKIRSGR